MAPADSAPLGRRPDDCIADSPVRALYEKAGLPFPIYDRKPTPTHDSGTWDSKVGVLAHRIIGGLAPLAQRSTPDERRILVREAVGATVKDRSLGRLDRARIRVTGMVNQYMAEFLPPPEVVFLGMEHRTGRSRVDLAWKHPIHGLFFDEIKTWRTVLPSFDSGTWAQLHCYLDAGRTTEASAFSGVRLLTLGHLNACTWISPEGLVGPLYGSPLCPVLMRSGTA